MSAGPRGPVDAYQRAWQRPSEARYGWRIGDEQALVEQEREPETALALSAA